MSIFNIFISIIVIILSWMLCGAAIFLIKWFEYFNIYFLNIISTIEISMYGPLLVFFDIDEYIEKLICELEEQGIEFI